MNRNMNMNKMNFGNNQFGNQNNFQNQLPDQNSGFMDFSSNFNDQQQQPQRQQNNMNNKRKMNGQQQNRSPKKNMNMNMNNFQQNKNWNNNGGNNNQQQQRRGPPPQMMNQQNQFQQFNPVPPMNRMPQANFRNNNNNNMRNNGNNMNFPPMQGQRRGPPPPPMNMRMGPGPIRPPPNMRGPPIRPQFQKFPNGMKNGGPQQNRKNPNLTKVDKPKNRKPQNVAAATVKKNANRGKKRQRDPYSLEAPFVTDEIKEEHKKKEDILESLKGKGKNDELFAKFKEQRDIFVKKYDEAKVAYQAEKKVSFCGGFFTALLTSFRLFPGSTRSSKGS